jgi:hypothetical protein
LAREGGAVVNLAVGRDTRLLGLPGLPHLGSGISWKRRLKEAKMRVLDMRDWSVIKIIETPGPGFFMRGHENTSYT